MSRRAGPRSLLRPSRDCQSLGIIALTVLSQGCHRPCEPIILTAELQGAYWLEVERRVPLWFGRMGIPAPGLPPAVEVFARARICEFPATPGTTCYFDPPDKIFIGSDKWDSGCVPHELGHMALHLIGSPYWKDFEHHGP